MEHSVSRLIAAGGLFTATTAKIQVEVRYSDNVVDVGNLDIFAQTWQKIYGSDGNQESVLSDVPTTTYNGGCNTWADEPNLNVKTTIDGEWGRVPGLGLHDSREGLVQALWAALKEVSDENQDCPCELGTAARKDHSLGHKVPSLIKANLYQDGVLLADSLEIKFESAEVAEKGGCDTVAQVAANFAEFIPGSGSIFAAGIKVACVYLSW